MSGRPGLVRDILAAPGSFPADTSHGFVGTPFGVIEFVADRGDSKDSASVTDDVIALSGGARVKDVDILLRVGVVESSDGVSGFVGAGIAMRGHDDAEADVLVPRQQATFRHVLFLYV